MIVNGERIVRDVVVVATSAGGLEAFGTLASGLPPGLPAGVAVVYHRNPYVDGDLLSILRRRASLPVVEPSSGDIFSHGTIYLAPRDRHLLLDTNAFILSRGPPLHHSRPAADALFTSAAQACGPRVIGVVLSGCGFDGARGSLAIKARGGIVVTQDLEDASFPWMPAYTLAKDHVDAVLTVPQIVQAVRVLSTGGALDVPPRPRGAELGDA